MSVSLEIAVNGRAGNLEQVVYDQASRGMARAQRGAGGNPTGVWGGVATGGSAYDGGAMGVARAGRGASGIVTGGQSASQSLSAYRRANGGRYPDTPDTQAMAEVMNAERDALMARREAAREARAAANRQRAAMMAQQKFQGGLMQAQRFGLLFGVGGGLNQLTGGNFPLFGPLSSMLGMGLATLPLSMATMPLSMGALGALELGSLMANRQREVSGVQLGAFLSQYGKRRGYADIALGERQSYLMPYAFRGDVPRGISSRIAAAELGYVGDDRNYMAGLLDRASKVSGTDVSEIQKGVEGLRLGGLPKARQEYYQRAYLRSFTQEAEANKAVSNAGYLRAASYLATVLPGMPSMLPVTAFQLEKRALSRRDEIVRASGGLGDEIAGAAGAANEQERVRLQGEMIRLLEQELTLKRMRSELDASAARAQRDINAAAAAELGALRSGLSGADPLMSAMIFKREQGIRVRAADQELSDAQTRFGRQRELSKEAVATAEAEMGRKLTRFQAVTGYRSMAELTEADLKDPTRKKAADELSKAEAELQEAKVRDNEEQRRIAKEESEARRKRNQAVRDAEREKRRRLIANASPGTGGEAAAIAEQERVRAEDAEIISRRQQWDAEDWEMDRRFIRSTRPLDNVPREVRDAPVSREARLLPAPQLTDYSEEMRKTLNRLADQLQPPAPPPVMSNFTGFEASLTLPAM
jgi:hypothetical protein